MPNEPNQETRTAEESKAHKSLVNRRDLAVLGLKLTTAALIALSILICALGLYLWNFNGPLSSDPERWAAFGAYLGGAVTPVLTCFTFLGLLLTIYYQRRELGYSTRSLDVVREELEQTKKASENTVQFNRDEVIRNDLAQVLEIISDQIQALFSETANFSRNHANFRYFFSRSTPWEEGEKIPEFNQVVRSHDFTILRELGELHKKLSFFLNDYEARFGNTAMVYYYKYRYEILDSRLIHKGWTKEHFNSPFQRMNFVAETPEGGQHILM